MLNIKYFLKKYVIVRMCMDKILLIVFKGFKNFVLWIFKNI